MLRTASSARLNNPRSRAGAPSRGLTGGFGAALRAFFVSALIMLMAAPTGLSSSAKLSTRSAAFMAASLSMSNSLRRPSAMSSPYFETAFMPTPPAVRNAPGIMPAPVLIMVRPPAVATSPATPRALKVASSLRPASMSSAIEGIGRASSKSSAADMGFSIPAPPASIAPAPGSIAMPKSTTDEAVFAMLSVVLRTRSWYSGSRVVLRPCK